MKWGSRSIAACNAVLFLVALSSVGHARQATSAGGPNPKTLKNPVRVNAASLELATVGLPNGPQPWVVPSSKSFCIGPVNADVRVSIASVW